MTKQGVGFYIGGRNAGDPKRLVREAMKKLQPRCRQEVADWLAGKRSELSPRCSRALKSAISTLLFRGWR